MQNFQIYADPQHWKKCIENVDNYDLLEGNFKIKIGSRNLIVCFSNGAWAGLWIRICIQCADPNPGGKIFQVKTEKMQGNCQIGN